MKGLESINGHQKFKELLACAAANALGESESAQLASHLLVCGECEEIYQQYRTLATEFIPLLALQYNRSEEQVIWDDARTRRELFQRIKRQQESSDNGSEARSDSSDRNRYKHFSDRLVPMCAAAVLCLVAGTGFLAVRRHREERLGADQLRSSPVIPANAPGAESAQALEDVNQLLDVQTKKTAHLESENSDDRQLVAKLRSQLETLTGQIAELKTANQVPLEQLASIGRERDSLAAQLQDAKKVYNDTRAELVNVRQERDELLNRSGLLETKLRESSTTERNQEDRLAEYERYMASDRDIRELMGARKLYIADVFDVDGYSRTQKPFGRIFYTEGKSLIFYAFDLQDRAKSAKASAFQVWGKSAEVTKPVNLGILYMDNESNRRWLLRVDDPDELARINSVFVTVEPHGGSQEPTSKPFLYALLWQKANHP